MEGSTTSGKGRATVEVKVVSVEALGLPGSVKEHVTKAEATLGDPRFGTWLWLFLPPGNGPGLTQAKRWLKRHGFRYSFTTRAYGMHMGGYASRAREDKKDEASESDRGVDV